MAARSMKKGQLVELGITAIIAGTAFLSLIMIPIFLRIHLLVLATSLYEYNNAQLSLLTLLSLQNKTQIYQNISTHLAFNNPSSTDFIKEKMNLISGCYNLSTPSKQLVSNLPANCDPKYTAEALIVLPYNPTKLVEKIRLGIG